jgi:hypothetical protein
MNGLKTTQLIQNNLTNYYTLFNMTAIEVRELIIKRNAIARAYCEKRGWTIDFSKLKMSQQNEIRKLPEWKNPK